MVAMRPAVLTFALALPLCAAAPQEPADELARPTAEQQRIERMRKDLARTRAHLHKPHAFRGSVRFTVHDDVHPEIQIDKDFVGATDGKDEWFTLGIWQVVQRGDRTAVSWGRDSGWGEPLDETPDVPLTPSLLLPHFATAKLTQPQPTMHDDRPAMRVHATWSGLAAKKVMSAASVPSQKLDQLVEGIAGAAGDGNDKAHVSATLVYDPATRRWIEASLRLAYLDGRPIPDDEEAPEAPYGLQPLPGRALFDAAWHLQACEPKLAPKPALNHEAHRVLAPRKQR